MVRQSLEVVQEVMNRMMTLLLLTVAIGLLGAKAWAGVVTYPAPAGEPLSPDYELWADGKKVDVYTARVLDPPFAGREWDFGGPYSFASFDMARCPGPASLRCASGSHKW